MDLRGPFFGRSNRMNAGSFVQSVAAPFPFEKWAEHSSRQILICRRRVQLTRTSKIAIAQKFFLAKSFKPGTYLFGLPSLH
jgi:hypothetical protein